MTDRTLLYYTSNRINDEFSARVREDLAASSLPIVSVSQKPLPGFGKNICVGDIGISIYNVYKQMLVGAIEVQTKYTVCCEDDALYPLEHLNFVPPSPDVFSYNHNTWVVDSSGIFYFRVRYRMSMCVCETSRLVDVLEQRFRICPEPSGGLLKNFSEPGKYDHRFGIKGVKKEIFLTNTPCILFNHRPSLGGVRKIKDSDILVTSLPRWGFAPDLWKKFVTGRKEVA